MTMKISVLTPSYNTGQYLERAIVSVLNQQYANWEHIVVDGGSEDDTLLILERYGHIKWVSEPDFGQSDAMNKAFRMSSGDLIVYLNADDELEPNIFRDVVDYFERNLYCSFLVGNLRCIREKGTSVSSPASHLIDILDIESGLAFPLNPVSYYYKRNVQCRVGDFPIDNHYTMDYWFLLRAYKFYRVYRLNKIFGSFYYHPFSKSSNVERAKVSLLNVCRDFRAENQSLLILLKVRYKFRIFVSYIKSCLKAAVKNYA
jgi:glycosyltransferase involved in cell wall biosynthesis